MDRPPPPLGPAVPRHAFAVRAMAAFGLAGMLVLPTIASADDPRSTGAHGPAAVVAAGIPDAHAAASASRAAAPESAWLDTSSLAAQLSAHRTALGLRAVSGAEGLVAELRRSPVRAPGVTVDPSRGRMVVAVAAADAGSLEDALAADPDLAAALEAPGITDVAAAPSADGTVLLLMLEGAAPVAGPRAEPAPDPAPAEQEVAELSRAAAARNLGEATGPVLTIGRDVRARSFRRGVVVTSSTYGAVALAPAVFEQWRRHPSTHGMPVSSAVADGRLTTRFELDELGVDARTRAVVRTDLTLGPQDVLTIGDSQVSPDTWVGQGLSQAGLHPVFYRLGGIGYTATASSSFGSYHDGVVEGYWALPQGSPGYVYIGGSGNDIAAGDAAGVRRAATEVVRELERRYPDAVIVMGGVVSTSEPSAAPRHAMDDQLHRVARAEGVRFVSMKDWITRADAEGYLVDGKHFSAPAGQRHMAPVFCEGFEAVMDR